MASSSTMNTVEADGDNPFLPQEIITNILKRLPVKSLIRFQCVCKHWKNRIETPSFIADHLHHSIRQNSSLLCQRNGRSDPFNLYVLDCDMQFGEVQNAPLINSFLCEGIISSSNGLLCIEIIRSGIARSSLLLYNPAIRQVRKVPGIANNFKGDFAFGFGFSPLANDYKIVKTYAEPGGVVNGVKVYSLSTGLWKAIEFGNLEDVMLYRETVTANGVMFWFASKLGDEEEGEDDIDLIVSFDIALEVFSLIPWPALDSRSNSQLIVYDNKLAMLCHTVMGNLLLGNFESTLVDLLVLEEGTVASGERWSWTKKYTTSLPCLLRPVTIWRNEVVCIVDLMPGFIRTEPQVENDEPKTTLSLSNLSTDECQIFRCSRVHSIFNYVESLVPLGHIHI